MTPVRKAIALVLLQPAIAAAADPAALRKLNLPGLDLLADLCEFLAARPGATAAAALENWRDTETGSHLERLAALELHVPEDGAAAEFEGLLADLARRGPTLRRKELETKLEEMGFGGLSQAEKDEYSALIRAERKEPQGGQNT